MKKKIDDLCLDHYDQKVIKRVMDEVVVYLVRHDEVSQQQMHDNLTALPDDVLYQVASLLPFADRCHLQLSCRKLYSLSKQTHFYRGLDRLNIEYSHPSRFVLSSAQESVAVSFKPLLHSEYSVFFNLLTLAAPHLSALSFKFSDRPHEPSEHATAFANLIVAIFEHMAAHWSHVIHEIGFDLSILIFRSQKLLMQECKSVRQMQESLARFSNLRCVMFQSSWFISGASVPRGIRWFGECEQFIAGAFPLLSEVTLIANETQSLFTGVFTGGRSIVPPVEQLTVQRLYFCDEKFGDLGRLRHGRLRIRQCHGSYDGSCTYFPHLTDLTFEESSFFYSCYRLHNRPDLTRGLPARLSEDKRYVRPFYDILDAPNLRYLRLTGPCSEEFYFPAFMGLDWDRIGQKYPLLEPITVITSPVSLLTDWPHLPTYAVSVQKLLACASRLPNLMHLHIRTCEMRDHAMTPLSESVWRDRLDALQAGCPNLQSIRFPFLCERLYVDWLLDLFQACHSLRRIYCDALCAEAGWTQSSWAKCQQFITYLAESLHNADVVHSVILSGSFFVGFPGLSQTFERLPLTEKHPGVMVTWTGQCHIIYKTTANVGCTHVQ